MEASTEKLCLEEISHSVCDADKKVFNHTMQHSVKLFYELKFIFNRLILRKYQIIGIVRIKQVRQFF